MQTLRHYAKLNLLEPSHIDDDTGYRFYKLEQIKHLHQIMVLKDLGLTLEQITKLLLDGVTEADIQAMLRLQEVQLERSVSEAQQQLLRVKARLTLMRQKQAFRDDVVLKQIDAHYVVAWRQRVDHVDTIEQHFTVLDNFLEDHHMKPTGPCFALFHDDRSKQTNLEVELMTPISHTLPEADGIRSFKLAALPLAACLIHQGSYQSLAASYARLRNWLARNHLQQVGAAREVYLRFADVATLYPDVYLAQKTDDFVTELQLPVQSTVLNVQATPVQA